MIIGVDEANYSPSLAGDCVVAAFARTSKKIDGVADSKKLTPQTRIKLFAKLQEAGLYQVELATVNEINQLGIYLARNRAIAHAIRSLLPRIQDKSDKFKIIVDGKFTKRWMDLIMPVTKETTEVKIVCMVGADDRVYEVSAASIIARVYADALFEGFGKFYPGYNIEHNHGSPDKKMYEKLRKDGPSPLHRTHHYAAKWWEKILGGRNV